MNQEKLNYVVARIAVAAVQPSAHVVPTFAPPEMVSAVVEAAENVRITLAQVENARYISSKYDNPEELEALEICTEFCDRWLTEWAKRIPLKYLRNAGVTAYPYDVPSWDHTPCLTIHGAPGAKRRCIYAVFGGRPLVDAALAALAE